MTRCRLRLRFSLTHLSCRRSFYVIPQDLKHRQGRILPQLFKTEGFCVFPLHKARLRASPKMSGSWAHETLYLLACWACFAAIGGLFYHYDSQPVPHWALDFSLNLVVSIPGHVIEALVACVVHSVTFQLLYHWYHKEARAVQHIKIFAKAARSVQGAFAILKLQRFAGLASHLALAYVISHGISTNVQQAISVRPKLVPFGVGTVPIATRVSRPLTSSSSISNLDNAMLAAMWSGFLGPVGDLPRIPAVCEGANECRWENYSTIGVAHRCEDISEKAVHCGDGPTSNCSYMLPTTGGALTADDGQRYTSMGYLFPDFMTNLP